MPANNEINYSELLSLSSAELYASLVPHIPTGGVKYHGAKRPPAKQIRKKGIETAAEAGRERFRSIQDDLYRVVCIKWNYCKQERSIHSDKVALVCSIAELISNSCGGLPVPTVAVILVKYGLSRFCKCPK